jgi:hypothetical protein
MSSAGLLGFASGELEDQAVLCGARGLDLALHLLCLNAQLGGVGQLDSAARACLQIRLPVSQIRDLLIQLSDALAQLRILLLRWRDRFDRRWLDLGGSLGSAAAAAAGSRTIRMVAGTGLTGVGRERGDTSAAPGRLRFQLSLAFQSTSLSGTSASCPARRRMRAWPSFTTGLLCARSQEPLRRMTRYSAATNVPPNTASKRTISRSRMKDGFMAI